MKHIIAHANNDKDHYSAKPPIFDGEKFDYWKERIKSFFIGCVVDLWDMVLDGYTRPIDTNVTNLRRSKMNEHQNKDYKNHRRSRNILMNCISYYEYENITNRDSAKSRFDSLKMTHEGNEQVKESKALALIQKYEYFKIEDDEMIEEMFLIFQTLVSGLKVRKKGNTTSDHVKKIIRSMPKKWKPMVTALKVSKDLNKTTLEELISSMRSHDIELEADEPKKR